MQFDRNISYTKIIKEKFIGKYNEAEQAYLTSATCKFTWNYASTNESCTFIKKCIIIHVRRVNCDKQVPWTTVLPITEYTLIKESIFIILTY